MGAGDGPLLGVVHRVADPRRDGQLPVERVPTSSRVPSRRSWSRCLLGRLGVGVVVQRGVPPVRRHVADRVAAVFEVVPRTSATSGASGRMAPTPTMAIGGGGFAHDVLSSRARRPYERVAMSSMIGRQSALAQARRVSPTRRSRPAIVRSGAPAVHPAQTFGGHLAGRPRGRTRGSSPPAPRRRSAGPPSRAACPSAARAARRATARRHTRSSATSSPRRNSTCWLRVSRATRQRLHDLGERVVGQGGDVGADARGRCDGAPRVPRPASW